MGDFIINILNYIISGIASFINFVINLLPKSPFHYLDNSSISDYIGYFNWLFPIDSMISFLELWLVAIGVYYLYSILMRWIKML